MAIKFEISLPSYGEPVIEKEISAPWLAKERREIRISLPLGYERLKYKLFFIDLTDGSMIGPFFNGQVVDFGSFGSRIKIKAILDKEYHVSFRDTIEVPMFSCGEYCPFKITYDYTGLIDIDFYNLALSSESFSSESILLERAKGNMEPMLRAIISRILNQNQASSGGISSELFYNLETNVNIAIQNGFHKLCTDYLTWCIPVSNIKIKNTNMEQVMKVLNTPIQIARQREQAVFDSTIRIREKAVEKAAEMNIEGMRTIGQLGATGVYDVDSLNSLCNTMNGSNYLEFANNVPGLNLDISTPDLSYLTEKKRK